MLDDSKLLDVLNTSGFPLQIAVEHLARSQRAAQKWRVAHAEHAWTNPNDKMSGFIDLVLIGTGENACLIIECKRVLKSSWIFLAEHPGAHVRDSKVAVSRLTSNEFYFTHPEIRAIPTTAESRFCTVFGESGKERSMLERVAAQLVSSVDAFALAEHQELIKERVPFRVYVGVIVTTAKLKVCKLDPSSIVLADGTLPAGEFADVPYVRFRKQLSHVEFDMGDFQGGISKRFSFAKEATVFVVNAEALEDFLWKFQVISDSPTDLA